MPVFSFILKKLNPTGFSLERLSKAQAGDETERNNLISDYRPFILRVTSESVGFFVVAGDSDEYSVALSAFNEAINSFDQNKGLNFLKFAENLMKWRLTDYKRKAGKWKNIETSLEGEYETGEREMDTDSRLSVEDPAYENLGLREQILELQQILRTFDIKFSDLVGAVPKHMDSRIMMIKIARTLAENPLLFQWMMEKKELPVARLVEITGYNRKTFYRNKNYIMALAIVFNSDLEDIRHYLVALMKEVAKS